MSKKKTELGLLGGLGISFLVFLVIVGIWESVSKIHPCVWDIIVSIVLVVIITTLFMLIQMGT